MGNVAGLDISMTATGVAVARDWDYKMLYSDCLQTNKSEIDPELDCILRSMDPANEIIRVLYEFEVDTCIIEAPAYNALIPIKTKRGVVMRMPQRTCQLWQFTGAIKNEVMRHWSGEVITVPPTTVKKHIAGNGKADKPDVAKALMERFGVRFGNYDISDAYALCVWHLDNI